MSGVVGCLIANVRRLTMVLDTSSIFQADGTTSPVTATPTGGIAPYTYAWSRVSGAVFSILTPTVNSTRFNGFNGNGLYRCTVTDLGGNQATADVDITFFTVGFP